MAQHRTELDSTATAWGKGKGVSECPASPAVKEAAGETCLSSSTSKVLGPELQDCGDEEG